MSLRVWFPFNDNANNQGASSVQITDNLIFNNNGKIGKCLESTTWLNLNIPQSIYDVYSVNNTEITYSLWFKIDKAYLNSWISTADFSSKTQIYNKLIGFSSGTTSNGLDIHIRTISNLTNATTLNQVYISGCLRNSSVSQVSTEVLIDLDKWYHAVVSYNKNNYLAFYLNGEFISGATVTRATTNTNISTRVVRLNVPQAYLSSSAAATRHLLSLKEYFNDVRIYDHALSAAEVHEISQGLVLHYKLDMPANINNNLYTGSEKFTGTWGNGGSWTTSTETYQNFVVKQRSNTWSGLYQNIPCTQNDIFTISFYGKVDSGGAIQSIHTSNLGNVTTGLQLLDGNFATSGSQFWVRTSDDGTSWKRYWATVKITGSDVTYLQWRLENSVSGKNFYICGLKLERGSAPTPWSPAASEAGETNIIRDSSGYNNNGVTYNSPAISSNTPRYSGSTLFDSSKSQCIKGSTGALVTDAITVSLWMYMSDWSTMTATMRPITAANSCGWYIDPYNDGYITIWVLVGPSSNNSNKLALRSNIKYKQLSSGWHHMAFTYDQASTKFYIEGELDSSKTWSTLKPIYYTSSTNLFLAAKVGSATAPNGGYFNGGLSDVRIYCTALSAADIKQLYEMGAKVDNKQDLHTYEFLENNQNKITKQGQVQASQISEFSGLSFLKYDPNTYIEPDGSAWVRIYHHNNPGAGSFSSSNDFAHSVYLDENRWFNVEVCDHLDKWEFMVKGKFTSTSAEWKVRWIQSVNPMTATYAQVAAANVTKITTNGYSSYLSSWGGLYAKKGSAYLTTNNGISGNWWGAVGSYSVYQNGIPGWGPSSTITTTGFNDLYVRIDNVTLSNMTVKTTKNNIWTANNLIEL